MDEYQLKPTRINYLLLSLIPFVSSFSVNAESLPCVIEPTETVELGSPVIGIIENIHVERGDTVIKDQIIAEIAAKVERKTVDLASLRIQDYSEVESAVAAKEHAKRNMNRASLLFEKKLISKQVLDQAITEEELSQHQLTQAREKYNQSKQELQLAKAKLDQRTLRSPINGIITERFLSPGNRVQDQPIVKIVAIDPLRVEVIAPSKYFKSFKKGESMWVKPDLPGFDEKEAVIKIIDHTLDTASNTFRITLEMRNPDHSIPAGARCSVNFSKAN